MFAVNTKPTGRKIVHRTRGRGHGPITRLMSPSDLGEVLKPFVFLDRIVSDGRIAPPPLEAGWHPHSGIATITVAIDGAVRIADTTGADVRLGPGGVEWMRASNGVWHSGTGDGGPGRAFQLWIALPPDLENAASESMYVQPTDVPVVGAARVILGSYEGVSSRIKAPEMTYLQVNLGAGETFRYEPAAGHDVAWIAVMAVSTSIQNGQVMCPASADTVPTDPWSTDTLTTDCMGNFKLCYTIKAGDPKNPKTTDCVLATSCVSAYYPVANQPFMMPPLPAWLSGPSMDACVQQFVNSGGDGEMSVDGQSDQCELVQKVFQRVTYCPLACNDPNSPATCAGCMPGGGGNF